MPTYGMVKGMPAYGMVKGIFAYGMVNGNTVCPHMAW